MAVKEMTAHTITGRSVIQTMTVWEYVKPRSAHVETEASNELG